MNISNLLEPFLPESSSKIKDWLNIDYTSWNLIEPKENIEIGDFSILFERLDKKLEDEELKNINKKV